MDFVWFLLLAIVSGVIAGMGMGGGTLLIPMLTIIMGVSQEVAQATNLLVFVPSGIICTIIYAKDKLVDFKTGGIITAGASILAIIAALVAVKLESKILKIIFACFIIALGLIQLIVFIVKKIKAKKAAKDYKNYN